MYEDDFPSAFVDDLRRLDWPRPGREALRTLFVSTEPRRDLQVAQPHVEEASSSKSQVVECPGPIAWIKVPNLGRGGLPVAALDEIAEWVAEE